MNNMKTALITGVNGQDGSYLSELLLEKGYMVHGIKRRTSTINTGRIDHLYHNPKFKLHYGDVTDAGNIISIIQKTQPDEIYNLAGMSHVQVSFEEPEHTVDVNEKGALTILTAIRTLGLDHKVKFYQASTSEMFGKVQKIPQDETTPFYPRSPYAISKQAAHWHVINHREAYGIFACSGILFNHESPRRGETFITRKITRAAVAYKMGLIKQIYVGNLDAQRDWGHAYDYVRAMYYMLQQHQPKDYVIATGVTTSVRDLIIMVFDILGMKIEFQKYGDVETGWLVYPNTSEWENTAHVSSQIIYQHPKYFRPTEVDLLIGNPSKAKKELAWYCKYDLRTMLEEMIQFDTIDIKKNGYNG